MLNSDNSPADLTGDVNMIEKLVFGGGDWNRRPPDPQLDANMTTLN